MMKKCNKHIMDALQLVSELLELAENGDNHAEDDNCVVLYGIIRDSAFKIKRAAESEYRRHRLKDNSITHVDHKSA